MNHDNLKALIEHNREILRGALPSFVRSLEKCRSLKLESPISFETEESFDALTSKFSRVSDIFTQKVLKSYLILLREDASTFLDRMNLCEKLGIIPSADDLIAIRDLRNLIAHEYLSENLHEVYSESIRLSQLLLQAIETANSAIDARSL